MSDPGTDATPCGEQRDPAGGATAALASKAMAYITSRALALGLVGGGARTFHIAHDLNVSTAHARRVMLSLERAGKVSRSERYTAANDIYWVPVWRTPPPLANPDEITPDPRENRRG